MVTIEMRFRPRFPRLFQVLAVLGVFVCGLSLAASLQQDNAIFYGTLTAPQEQEQQKKSGEKKKNKDEKEGRKEQASQLPAALWRDPGDISTLDMINGEGGAGHAPKAGAEYTFVKEDMNGTSPKFYVKDSEGVEWLVKLGPEAKPETAATRFTWAMGYFADEDYFLAEIHVAGLPQLRRRMYGASVKTGIVPNVRLKRKDKDKDKKVDNWSWYDNPFVGTREYNGLRVLMALINNWDLKEVNNKIYMTDTERRFVTSDLGESFGKTGMIIPLGNGGNLKDYENAKFIKKRTADTVSFVMNTHSPIVFKPFAWKLYSEYARLVHLEENIPIADAIWIGGQLAKLTPQQIRDAFRAAGYPPETVEGFARTFESRVAELNNLRNPCTDCR
jgi:hypothetical protein